MGLFKDLHGSRYMMQLLIIKLVCCLGWLSAIVCGQEIGDTLSGAVSFPDLGVTCLGNLAVFFSSFLRGRLYLEMGAQDALTMLTRPIKLKKIKGWQDISMGFGLTTCGKRHLADCSVVMLSKETPNWSMRQFVEYVANVHHVHSVLLQYFPLQSVIKSLPLTIGICNCPFEEECGCIIFWTCVDVTVMVAEQIPGTLKPLSDSLCLLPSIDCLKNGCHGCNQGLLHVHVEEIVNASYFFEEIEPYLIHDDVEDKNGTTNHGQSHVEETHDVVRTRLMGVGVKRLLMTRPMMGMRRLMMRRHMMGVTDVEEGEAANEFGTKKRVTEGEPKVEHSAAVCGSLYSDILKEPANSICIPVLHKGDEKRIDRWTELLVGSFKSEDYEIRGGIIRREISSVSDDLKNYLDEKGKCYATEEYSIVSLILPRLTAILINAVLVFLFKVDGFSSSLVCRRAVRNYIADGSRRGFAGHVFVNKAEVRSNDNNANAYQVLSFRGNVCNPKALSVMVGIVNLACSITWAVLVAMEGHCNKWYHTHSMPPSKGRLLVIFVGIAIALAMDCVDLYLYFPNARSSFKRWLHRRGKTARSSFKRWLHCRGKTDIEEQQEKRQKLLYRAIKAGGKEKQDDRRRKMLIVCTMIVFQILCIVSISVVGRALGVKAFRKWVYGAVQGLVWLKWGIGSYLLGKYIPRECSGPAWTYGSTGMYMYSSAFGLNAVLAGARAKWELF